MPDREATAKQITERELRNDSGAILRAVRDEGQHFVITTNGTPVAELRPLPRKTAFVPTAELVRGAANLPRIDYARFRADLDAVIDDSSAGDESGSGS